MLDILCQAYIIATQHKECLQQLKCNHKAKIHSVSCTLKSRLDKIIRYGVENIFNYYDDSVDKDSIVMYN
jgi:hypothetical protein